MPIPPMYASLMVFYSINSADYSMQSYTPLEHLHSVDR